MVGLFGKEKSYDSDKSIEIFDFLAQKNIFASQESLPNETVIRGFFDSVNRRIYLNLFSRQKDSKYVQNLLFLFHVCNLIICFNPSYNFDQSYLRLFQTLEASRGKFQAQISSKLKTLKIIPKWWSQFGRSCNPRVIFYFASCPLELRGQKGLTEIIKKTGKLTKHPPIKRLEFSLEDQIHRVFKRARITHTSNNLFNLSTKDNYVYVKNSQDDCVGESIQDHLDYYFGSEQNEDFPDEFMPHFYQQSVKDAYGSRSFGNFMANHFDTMVQRGPDNIDGSRHTSEVSRFMDV